MSERVTAAEFARRKGVTDKAVRDAINTGRLSAKKEGNRVWLDLDVANREWEVRNPGASSAVGGGKSDAYNKAREIREKANAEKAILEVAVIKKNLISIEQVKRHGFAAMRTVRNQLQAIPTKIAHEVAAETDPHLVELILIKEIDQALEAGSEIIGVQGEL